jgi:hypothetical protein
MGLEVRFYLFMVWLGQRYGLLYMIEVDLMYIMYHLCSSTIIDDTTVFYTSITLYIQECIWDKSDKIRKK